MATNVKDAWHVAFLVVRRDGASITRARVVVVVVVVVVVIVPTKGAILTGNGE